MITAGIDCGAKNVRVLVLGDGKLLGKGKTAADMDTAAAAERAFDEALAAADLTRDEVTRVLATGTGKNDPACKHDVVAEVGAVARGMHFLEPEVRTVIDVGAEEGRAIKLDAEGTVVDFVINDKCAAGVGAFLEAMARALEVPLEEIGALALQSTAAVPINARCVVFAESEVVALVHQKTAKPDVARAIHDAIADQVSAMCRRVGVEERVAVIGGVANNVGFVQSLTADLGSELVLVDELEYVGALGAALVATD